MSNGKKRGENRVAKRRTWWKSSRHRENVEKTEQNQGEQEVKPVDTGRTCRTQGEARIHRENEENPADTEKTFAEQSSTMETQQTQGEQLENPADTERMWRGPCRTKENMERGRWTQKNICRTWRELRRHRRNEENPAGAQRKNIKRTQ